MNPEKRTWEQVYQAFQRIWGYKDFRPPQGEIIRCLLASQDTLIVMPTGGGKSICFQLPALLQKGLTLVISPLVALMENQVKELQERNLPTALLHNEIPRNQRKDTLKLIATQQLRLLYLSPETLLSLPVWEILINPNLIINGIILDEAHCLVQWGETFRPAYRRLGTIRSALLKHKPPETKIAIAAFTATANPNDQGIISSVLHLENPQVFCLNPYRSNFNLQVKIAWSPRCRRHLLLNFIQSKKQQSGLIYVRSRRDSEALAQWLNSLQNNTASYHAGLSPQQRREIEEKWLKNELQFVVCTSAFGMGINKADVRWVIHFQPPSLLSEYLQEIGRGGRDGKPTDVLMLMSEPTGWLDPTDKQRQQYFMQKLEQQNQEAKRLINQIPKQGNIRAIAQEFPQGEIILSLLHSQGQLEWLDPFNYRIKSTQVNTNSSNSKSNQLIYYSQIKQYLITRDCRWQFLLKSFGFHQDAKNFRCGHCDNCRR
ncbi:ATP-dependent DNA helicase, RecQ family [Rippkaea orientalis PCC 8801]|uniref:ATP-dependent DNA helicase RecQ n=1 Tax=Rippkaea orientalis (strain PCC 8801 / RF-1) TaxID=41431 RepID=B7JVG7_RIPO1|nr:RecQ family ATP-dependent DNA helicase [Rippkaea orientalis]ACK68300.1 ATP-dependent DNA helicase, RecQ family [Rippkaea orientalis PCC 8801]